MTSAKSSYILRFEECGLAAVPQVGQKNACLGDMLNAGFPIPPGFAITTSAYARFLESGPGRDIRLALHDADPHDVVSIQEAEASIRRTMESSAIPEEIRAAIESAYERLCEEWRPQDRGVAVRSSATTEGVPGASFAGTQETFLRVRGVEALLHSTLKCWSSLFTARAMAYRLRMGYAHEQVLISVGVQTMVSPRTAGVLCTLNPLNGDLSKIVIEACSGSAERLMQGEVTPNRYVVDKVTFDILSCNIPADSGTLAAGSLEDPTRSRHAGSDGSQRATLTDDEVVGLAGVAKQIERHYGVPQDIEWALDSGEFPESVAILQARSESVWSTRSTEPILQPKASVLEYVTQSLLRGVEPVLYRD